jgi:hypothetical protein
MRSGNLDRYRHPTECVVDIPWRETLLGESGSLNAIKAKDATSVSQSAPTNQEPVVLPLVMPTAFSSSWRRLSAEGRV